MSAKIETKWMTFVEQAPNPKTRVFSVASASDDSLLGTISWYGPWRHYVFFPNTNFQTVLSDRCLKDLSEFVEKLNKEHKTC